MLSIVLIIYLLNSEISNAEENINFREKNNNINGKTVVHQDFVKSNHIKGDRAPASYIPPTIQDQIRKKEKAKIKNKSESTKPKESESKSDVSDEKSTGDNSKDGPEPDLRSNTPKPVISTQLPDDEENHYGLSGGWGGYRKKLSDQGIDVAVIYKSDLTRNVKGGVESHTSYLDNLDLRFNFDMEKLVEVKGLTFFVYGIMNSGADGGNRPSKYVGDLQWTSNIETFVDDFKLYQAYIQQTFLEDKASILFGLHDLNSEFYVTNTATLFLHSSFGLGLELSQAGPNGPSVFPYTAPAIRFKVEPSKNVYMQTAVFNAQAGSPTNQRGTHFRLNSTDGRLIISEFGVLGDGDNPSKIAVGYWSFTRTFDHFSEMLTDINGNTVPQQVASAGTYLLIDHSFSKSFSAFLTYGVATSASNPVKDNLTVGFVSTGLIPGQEEDRLGLGLSRVTPGDEFSNTTVMDAYECAIELTYRWQIMNGLALQPDLQYVINPGLNPDIEDAFVTTVRLELGL